MLRKSLAALAALTALALPVITMPASVTTAAGSRTENRAKANRNDLHQQLSIAKRRVDRDALTRKGAHKRAGNRNGGTRQTTIIQDM